jgi:hypothetical protein
MVDFFSADHAQEIDILVWNEQMQGGFASFGEKNNSGVQELGTAG